MQGLGVTTAYQRLVKALYFHFFCAFDLTSFMIDCDISYNDVIAFCIYLGKFSVRLLHNLLKTSV